MTDAVVIGGGPAGLMAAETLLDAGFSVLLAEQKPTPGRKFLMAGKSGLNLTMDAPERAFLSAYTDPSDHIVQAVRQFGSRDVQAWADALGQPLFAGSSGRMFPHVMKASPLLRAWLERVRAKGLDLRVRWRWDGWDQNGALVFQTPEGTETVTCRATVLATGGASWPGLGSDGVWAAHLPDETVPFAPSNAALQVAWSPHMARHFGAPLKSIALRAGDLISRGECILSQDGLEGSGVYSLSPAIRAGATLHIDLMPDVEADQIKTRLAKGRKGDSLANRLRKLGLGPEKVALFQEFGRGAADIAMALKDLPVPHQGLAGLERAISSVGGIATPYLTPDLMLRDRPGVFVAGEMIDWDAPTGGYLLTACLATGRQAGHGAAHWLSARQAQT